MQQVLWECALLTWLVVSAAGDGGPREPELCGVEGSGLPLLPWDQPCLKGAPRDAPGQPLPSPLGCQMGCRGRKRGAVPSWDGQSWWGGSFTPGPRTWLLSPQTPMAQRPMGQGAAGGQSGTGASGKSLADVAPGKNPHPPEPLNLACFSPAGM